MTNRRGRRRRRRGAGNGETVEKENTPKQWNDLFLRCEKKVQALMERLSRPDRLTVMFSAETESVITGLQEAYEKIMVNDPQGRGREAEAQCWRVTFNDTYQVACNCLSSLNPAKLERLDKLISKASAFYRGLMKAVAAKASEEIRKLTLTGPVGLRWNPISIQDNPQDQFVLDVVHAAYIHLGDLARRRSTLNTNSLNQGFWASERLYRCAINLKPRDGYSYGRLASMCADVDANIDAVFFHLVSTKVEQASKEAEEYLQFLFEFNDNQYFQNTNKIARLEYLQLRVNAMSTKLFTCSCLRVFHYLYRLPMNWSFRRISDLCQENLHFIDACFRYCCLCRFPGLDTAHFNASIVRVLVCLQIMLFEHFRINHQIRLMVFTLSWMLSFFSSFVVALEDFILICYDSAKVDVGSHYKASRNPFGPPRGAGLQSSEPERADALKGDSIQEGTKTGVTIAIRKLRSLERLKWLEVLKVMFDWFCSHPNLIHSMDVRVWPRVVSLLNLLPNEAELAEVANAPDTPIAKEAVQLFSTPLSSWLQSVALPEDVDVYSIIEAGYICDERVSSFDHLSTCFLRICNLLSFGRYLVYIRLPQVRYNVPLCAFADGRDSYRVNTSYDPMRRDPRSVARWLIKDKDPMPNIPVHLIPDPSALAEHVHLIKEMLKSGNHILVITMSTMEKLAHWRKSMPGARQAAHWLEYELDHQSNYICVHSCDTEVVEDEHGTDKNGCPYLDIIDACCRLRTDGSIGTCNAAILTGKYEDSEKFECFKKVAAKLPNAMVRNVYEFYVDWFYSSLYKTYHKIYGNSERDNSGAGKGRQ